MSRPQVTITLGRSGQVVKRRGQVVDSSRSNHVQPSRGKRSVRERLGSNVDNQLVYGNQPKSKRQRGDGNKWAPSYNVVNGAQIGRDDLRLKLIRKNMSRGTRSEGRGYGMDRQRKLPRTEHSAVTNSRQRMPDSKVNGLVSRIPSRRSADDLLHMNSLRKSYSSWTMDGMRSRSPYRNLGTSRGLSPPRNMNDRRQVSSLRNVDASRQSYMSKDNLDSSRYMGPPIYMTKTGVAPDLAKPVARLPPPSGVMQRSSYMGEEAHTTVGSLLHSLGLEKYTILFRAEEVDMTALRQMGDNDLKDLGIPMGPRKKILLAVMPRSKRQSWTSRP